MCGAVTLLGFGLYVVGDSVLKLAVAEHPIGQTAHLFGTPIWLGWLMIAALTYGAIPPMILGRMKSRSRLGCTTKLFTFLPS